MYFKSLHTVIYVITSDAQDMFSVSIQPEKLTEILEYSNIVFCVLFATEMSCKILAYGAFGYISDGFNVFDGFIVILR